MNILKYIFTDTTKDMIKCTVNIITDQTTYTAPRKVKSRAVLTMGSITWNLNHFQGFYQSALSKSNISI